MIIPIRCKSCGKPIAHLREEYLKRTESGEEIKIVLDDFGLDRYCCRSIMMGHIDLIDDIMKIKKF